MCEKRTMFLIHPHFTRFEEHFTRFEEISGISKTHTRKMSDIFNIINNICLKCQTFKTFNI